MGTESEGEPTLAQGFVIARTARQARRDEAVALRRAFAAELDRLYEAADEARPEVRGADF